MIKLPKAERRYTINIDGTIENWYLEQEDGDFVWLRKTEKPKYNCCMKRFPASDVYITRQEAAEAMKGQKR